MTTFAFSALIDTPRAPNAKKLLAVQPEKWNGKRTAEIALMHGLSIKATVKALQALADEGFAAPGLGRLICIERNGVRRSNAHRVWFFQ